MIAPGIQITDAHLEYKNHSLFQGLNLTVSAGQWTCLLGPSGVGKSSLLRLIGGLKTAAASSDPIRASDEKPLIGRMAYLAQNEPLLPWLTALENVVIGPKLRGETVNSHMLQQAKELLVQVGLANFQHHLPEKLSGGMQQRVLLARTLFENKPIILLDEPFAALDVITRTLLQDLAAELLVNRTVLLVTHDPFEALRLGHDIYVMSGKPAVIQTKIVLETKPPRELTDPNILKAHAELLQRLRHAKEVMEG